MTPDPSSSERTSVTLSSDRLEARVLTFGSSLAALRFDGGPNLTMPPKGEPGSPDSIPYLGPIVAPVANRLTVPLALDGRDLPITPVRSEGWVLHSGDGGTHDRVWHIEDQSGAALTLAIDLPDGLGGFPGNRRVTIIWRIDGADLSFDITATTDAPTLMNIAHHPFWALNGTGRDGQTLMSPASRYTPITPVITPTGEIRDVAGTDYDFRTPRTPAPTLDANLCLSDAPTDTPRLVARLAADRGPTLDILSTAPGLQVFTGKPYGIALEPQFWPNAPAHPAFPSIRLDPGDTFRQTTIYRFS